jgi:hypothetical protein
MGTMGIIIFAVSLVTIVNIFTTKELTEMLSETIFDNTTFYRICLIPPIGAITFGLVIIVVITVAIMETIRNIWR